MNKIKLDIISDVVCPWCIIGYKRLEKAISELGTQDRVELEWQPFELNPNMPSEGEDVEAHRAHKYGMTKEDGKKSQANMTELGAELGFKFDFFENMRIVNTREAHILLDYAKESGKQTELKLHLFEAFFSQRKNISKREILKEVLYSVGLNVDEALLRLDDDDVREQVITQEKYWQGLGVSSVPTIVFNRSSAINGAQPVEVYKQILTELIEQ